MRAFILATSLLLLSFNPALRAADDYVLGPDSKTQPGVPHGEVTKYTFDRSTIFPGTTRDYWIYVPTQYDASKPTCVMFFQDGIQYSAPTVFDNLIQRGEIPVMIGVFVMHGRVKAADTNALDRYNRSYEYDGMGGDYTRFLLEEILPEVAKKYNVSTDPNDRAIAGASSGAIAAFTAAWERPDAFSRVFSSIGTFVGLRGGNEYPILIRKTDPKPIRVFLQDGSNDQNIYGGNWFLANQEMLSALEFAGYEVNHAWGDGGHNGKHAGAIFPDALRWLWKGYPTPVAAGLGSAKAREILVPGEGWQLVSTGVGHSEGLAVNEAGEVFFSDSVNDRIFKVGKDGKPVVFATGCAGVRGLAYGASGYLYGCENGAARIAVYDASGRPTPVLRAPGCAGLAINHQGEIYFTDPAHHKIWFVNRRGQKVLVDEGIAEPVGVQFTPDQSLLIVTDARGQFAYSFHIQPDGTLTARQRYFCLHLAPGSGQSYGGGMAVDNKGWLYVATEMGVQICDQPGRVNVILPPPQRSLVTGVALGGPKFNELYVTCGDKIYKRVTKATGVLSALAPVRPPTPGL